MKAVTCVFLFCVAFYIAYNELRRKIQLDVDYRCVNSYGMVML